MEGPQLVLVTIMWTRLSNVEFGSYTGQSPPILHGSAYLQLILDGKNDSFALVSCGQALCSEME